MSKQPRTLESFVKADLITLIRKRWFRHEQLLSDLAWIEYNRVFADYMAKSEALIAEMRACALPQDWAKYKALDGQYEQLQRKVDRAQKAASA